MQKSDLLSDPAEQFKRWYQEAQQEHGGDADAMTLATANAKGRPSARTVLYKGMDEDGFLIFTNYNSRKAKEFIENPYAALVFYWPGIYKQVRIEGRMEKITQTASQKYFETRPFESKISAWVSEQSQPIPNREYLLERHRQYENEFKKTTVPCPDFWGGFHLIPEYFEFWLGRDHRLHDRFCYKKNKEAWEIVQLAP